MNEEGIPPYCTCNTWSLFNLMDHANHTGLGRLCLLKYVELWF